MSQKQTVTLQDGTVHTIEDEGVGGVLHVAINGQTYEFPFGKFCVKQDVVTITFGAGGFVPMIESIMDGLGAAFLTAYKTLIYPHVRGHIDRRTPGARTEDAPPYKAVFPRMELNGLPNLLMNTTTAANISSVIACLRLLHEAPGHSLHFSAISPHLVTIPEHKRHGAFFHTNRDRIPIVTHGGVKVDRVSRMVTITGAPASMPPSLPCLPMNIHLSLC